MLVLATMGGLLALPGMENLIDILNWGWRKWTGQYHDLRLEAREVAQEIGLNPDYVMHGLSHNMFGLGWNVSSSVGQGRIIPGTDAIFGIGKFEDRFLSASGEIGGPIGSLGLSVLKAVADDNPNTLLRFQSALPAAFRNLAKAYNIVDSGGEIQDRHGRALVQDATAAETLGQGLGFQPSRLAERQELMRMQHDAAEFYAERRANLLEMYYNAKTRGDADILYEVKTRIDDYNQNVPDKKLRINPDDISRSLKMRSKLEADIEANRSPQKRYAALYSLLNETYTDH
jgi:hypothetical protein